MENPNLTGKRFLWKPQFDDVIAAGCTDRLSMIGTLGSGMTLSQAGGNLLVTTGITANQDLILRSVDSFRGPVELKHLIQLSQRIANQSFFIELVDIMGDNIPVTINSSTSITIQVGQEEADRIGGASGIGQKMYLGSFAGTAGMIPGQYIIASVASTPNGVNNLITFTVAGFPASGSGTVCAFGYNYHHIIYDGIVATNAKYGASRFGWPTNDVTITTNTSAAPGTYNILQVEEGISAVLEGLAASSTSSPFSVRAQQFVGMPDTHRRLFVQVRIVNGTVAPASTTTMTLGEISVDDYNPSVVSIASVRPQGVGGAVPIIAPNGIASAAAPSVITGQVIPTVSATAAQGPTLLSFKLISGATTNAAFIKAAAGRAVGGHIGNTGAAPRFVKFYNLATAPTVGTSVPVLTLAVPINGSVELAGVFSNFGDLFSVGIAIAITTNAADTDATALSAASDTVVNVLYI